MHFEWNAFQCLRNLRALTYNGLALPLLCHSLEFIPLLRSHKTSDIPPLVSAFQKLKSKRNVKRNSKKKRTQEEKILKS